MEDPAAVSPNPGAGAPGPGMTWGAIHSQPGAVGAAGFTPGSEFGRYRIEGRIGEGGMGAVYRALDTELNRTVALKLVRPELATNPQAMQRFKQELLLASRISHKNILRIHDLGDWNGVKFISMAFVEGTDLAGLLDREGRLPQERALRFTCQLAAALEAAHAEGVVHRDLKPQNILIDRGDNVYISDFGLAKSLEAEISMGTRTGQILGTPRYMSPEQVEAREVDSRSDLYSLGLMIYEMFTGEMPFRGESAMQLMYQRVAERPRDPRQANPEVPDYIANIILKCLEKNPDRRYQSAREILADLDARHAPSVGARAANETISLQIPKPTRRGLLWTAAAAMALAGALAAIPGTRHGLQAMFPGAKAADSIQYRMAVLPLRVVGEAQGLQYIADGVVDAVRAKLAGLHNVYLAPAPPDAGSLDDGALARKLGVAVVVRGTLQGAGDQLGITLTADDVAAHRTLLHREFRGVRQDLLRLEDQVFNDLADTLLIRRTNEENARNALRPTQDQAAYDLYLQAASKIRVKASLADYRDGLRMFEAAKDRDPYFPLAYAGIADASLKIYRETNDPADIHRAQSAAEQAERLNPNLPEAHASLGTIYKAIDRLPEAIHELQQALKLAPNSDDVLRRLGATYDAAGQKQEAIAAFQQAIRVNPYLGTSYFLLGATYLDLGENQKARDVLLKATTLDPGNPSAWFNLGKAYYRLEQMESSIQAFHKAIQINPKPTYYSSLGVVYFFEGRFTEAVAAFQTAIDKGAKEPYMYVNLGDAYRWSNQQPKASTAYDRAIELALKKLETNPQDQNTLGPLATAYAKEGDFPKAEAFIRQARQIDPKYNDLMYREAAIYALAGQPDQALRSLREALSNGYSVLEARKDPELANLRARPEFAAMLREIAPNLTK